MGDPINMTLILVKQKSVIFHDVEWRSEHFSNLLIFIFSDEFSSQDEEDDINGSRSSIQDANRRPASKASMPKIISRCKAIYAYTPKLDDELEINPGLWVTLQSLLF